MKSTVGVEDSEARDPMVRMANTLYEFVGKVDEASGLLHQTRDLGLALRAQLLELSERVGATEGSIADLRWEVRELRKLVGLPDRETKPDLPSLLSPESSPEGDDTSASRPTRAPRDTDLAPPKPPEKDNDAT